MPSFRRPVSAPHAVAYHGTSQPPPDSDGVQGGPGCFRNFMTDSKYSPHEKYFSMHPDSPGGFRTLDISKANDTLHNWSKLDTFQTPSGHSRVADVLFEEVEMEEGLPERPRPLSAGHLAKCLSHEVSAVIGAGIAGLRAEIAEMVSGLRAELCGSTAEAMLQLQRSTSGVMLETQTLLRAVQQDSSRSRQHVVETVGSCMGEVLSAMRREIATALTDERTHFAQALQPLAAEISEYRVEHRAQAHRIEERVSADNVVVALSELQRTQTALIAQFNGFKPEVLLEEVCRMHSDCLTCDVAPLVTALEGLKASESDSAGVLLQEVQGLRAEFHRNTVALPEMLCSILEEVARTSDIHRIMSQVLSEQLVSIDYSKIALMFKETVVRIDISSLLLQMRSMVSNDVQVIFSRLTSVVEKVFSGIDFDTRLSNVVATQVDIGLDVISERLVGQFDLITQAVQRQSPVMAHGSDQQQDTKVPLPFCETSASGLDGQCQRRENFTLLVGPDESPLLKTEFSLRAGETMTLPIGPPAPKRHSRGARSFRISCDDGSVTHNPLSNAKPRPQSARAASRYPQTM